MTPDIQNGQQNEEFGECFGNLNILNRSVDGPKKDFQFVLIEDPLSIIDQEESEGVKQECDIIESSEIDCLNGNLNVKEEDCFGEIVKEEHDNYFCSFE